MSDDDLTLESNERSHITRVMAACEGNISKAARQLGIYRRSLQRKLVRMGYRVETKIELCGWPGEDDIECQNAVVPPAHACPKHLAVVATWRMGSVDIGEPDEDKG